MKERGKKGISPVIATILLVSIVLVAATITFLWARGFVQEEATKFGKNIKLVCEDVNFNARYSQGKLNIVNEGNVPIFRLKIKMAKSGGYETQDINELSGEWPVTGLSQGEVFSGSIGALDEVNKIIIIPMLIGSSGKGEKVYICEELYGFEIEL